MSRLDITLSAFQELAGVPPSLLPQLGDAIVRLADESHPSGSLAVAGQPGCRYLLLGDYVVLYHVTGDEHLTILGVLHGPYHQIH